MIIGIDIGGTNFRIGTVDENRKVYNLKKVSVKNVFHNEKVLESLKDFLCEYINESNYQIEAISIGFPATINKERTKVLQAPNIKYIENLDVVEYLGNELNIPVYLEKDTTMLMYYDKNKYGLPDEGIISCIYFGTGVGSMLMIDGKVIKGRNGTAGELGHLYVEGNELVCGCGNVGCNESVVGGNYLDRLIKDKFIGTDISDIFTFHNDDPLIKQYVDRMGVIVADIENILDPDYVILGGGVLNTKDFPKELLIERILAHTRKPLPADNMNLIFAEESIEKGVVGAANYAYSMLNNH